MSDYKDMWMGLLAVLSCFAGVGLIAIGLVWLGKTVLT